MDEDKGSLAGQVRRTDAERIRQEAEAERVRVEADAEAERIRHEADAERFRQESEAAVSDPEAQKEWIRQDNLIYGGLVGAGLLLVQPFLTATTLDLSATVSVIAFAISTPLLAALLLVNRQETFRERRTPSPLVSFARAVAQGSAFVGVVAAFWHISWIAGVVLLVLSVLGVAVHTSGYVRLEHPWWFRRKRSPEPR